MRNNFAGTEDHFVNFEEFVKQLQIQADDFSYTLFKQFVAPGDNDTNVINFKEYLNHSLLLVKIQEAKIEFVRLLFMVSCGDPVCFTRNMNNQIDRVESHENNVHATSTG